MDIEQMEFGYDSDGPTEVMTPNALFVVGKFVCVNGHSVKLIRQITQRGATIGRWMCEDLHGEELECDSSDMTVELPIIIPVANDFGGIDDNIDTPYTVNQRHDAPGTHVSLQERAAHSVLLVDCSGSMGLPYRSGSTGWEHKRSDTSEIYADIDAFIRQGCEAYSFGPTYRNLGKNMPRMRGFGVDMCTAVGTSPDGIVRTIKNNLRIREAHYNVVVVSDGMFDGKDAPRRMVQALNTLSPQSKQRIRQLSVIFMPWVNYSGKAYGKVTMDSIMEALRGFALQCQNAIEVSSTVVESYADFAAVWTSYTTSSKRITIPPDYVMAFNKMLIRTNVTVKQMSDYMKERNLINQFMVPMLQTVRVMPQVLGEHTLYQTIHRALAAATRINKMDPGSYVNEVAKCCNANSKLTAEERALLQTFLASTRQRSNEVEECRDEVRQYVTHYVEFEGSLKDYTVNTMDELLKDSSGGILIGFSNRLASRPFTLLQKRVPRNGETADNRGDRDMLPLSDESASLNMVRKVTCLALTQFNKDVLIPPNRALMFVSSFLVDARIQMRDMRVVLRSWMRAFLTDRDWFLSAVGWDSRLNAMLDERDRDPLLGTPTVSFRVHQLLRLYGADIEPPAGLVAHYSSVVRVHRICNSFHELVRTRTSITHTFSVPDDTGTSTGNRFEVGQIVEIENHRFDPSAKLPSIVVIVFLRMNSRKKWVYRGVYLDRPGLLGEDGNLDSTSVYETDLSSRILGEVDVPPHLQWSFAKAPTLDPAAIEVEPFTTWVASTPALNALNVAMCNMDHTFIDATNVEVRHERARNKATCIHILAMHNVHGTMTQTVDINVTQIVSPKEMARLMRHSPIYASETLVDHLKQMTPHNQHPTIPKLIAMIDCARVEPNFDIAPFEATFYHDRISHADRTIQIQESEIDKILSKVSEKLRADTGGTRISDDQPLYAECPICTTPQPYDQFVSCSSCPHSICSTCTTTLREKPEKGVMLTSAPFTCLFCRNTLPLNWLDDPGLEAAVDRWLTNGAGPARRCTGDDPQCMHIVNGDGGGCGNPNTAVPRQCPECSMPDGFHSWVEHEKRRYGRYPRRCPGCNQWAAMDIGDQSCSHSTCDCGHQFCVVCLQHWEYGVSRETFPDRDTWLYPGIVYRQTHWRCMACNCDCDLNEF